MKVSFTRKQLETALAATSSSPTRAGLMWIRVESTRLVATDGHRLVIVSIDGDPTANEVAHISSDDARRLVKMGDSKAIYTIETGDEAFMVANAQSPSQWRGQLAVAIDGRPMGHVESVEMDFAQYEKVLPSKAPNLEIAFNAQYLKDMCDAAMKATDNKGVFVKLELTGSLEVAKFLAYPKGEYTPALVGLLMPARF